MAKRLRDMTSAELKMEMSLAGSPDKIMDLGDEILRLVYNKMDKTNIAEHINVILMLRRIVAEIDGMQKREEKRQRNNYWPTSKKSS